MADDLTATVAGMQARHYRIPDYAGICRSDHQKWPCDASLVLAAVEAVLKAADSAEPAMYETGVGPREPIAWNLDPAKVREAIRAALSGKKAGDG